MSRLEKRKGIPMNTASPRSIDAVDGHCRVTAPALRQVCNAHTRPLVHARTHDT